MPAGPPPKGDLAVGIQPVDDLIDHGHEQVLIAEVRAAGTRW